MPFTKMKSKLIINLRVKVKMIKLENNTGKSLNNLGFGDDFLDKITKEMISERNN
jgi:hypothetical protein